MKTFAIASDYDGTIADEGRVAPATLEALRRFRDAGHRLLLVTGRELGDLRARFPEYAVFESIVGENGGLLYDTQTDTETVLAEAPPASFIDLLRRRNVGPLYIGRVLIATLAEHQGTIATLLVEQDLDLHLILNKEAVMVLPHGVNKAFGLRAALQKMGLEAAQTAAVGDAENDRDLLAACGFAVAVQNAIPDLKSKADWVTAGASGVGVIELVDQILNAGLQAPKTWRKAQ